MSTAQLASTANRPILTAATMAALIVAVIVVWLARPLLANWLDDELAAFVQSAAVTVGGAVAAVVLVVVWDLEEDVRLAFVPPLDGQAVVRLMVSLLVLATAYTLTRVTRRFIKHGYRRDAISRHQREVGHNLLQLVVFGLAVLVVLGVWGVEPSNLLLGAGALGLVVGLAARHTLSAMLAGFVLLVSRPFQIGDWVVIRDVEGLVTDVTVFNTRIRTFDGEQVTVPNDVVTGAHVVNRSTNGRLRLEVEVGIDYEADAAAAADVAQAAMADVEEVLSTPEPTVVLDRFGDSAVVLGLRFWIADPTIQRKWRAQNAVVAAVKEALEAEGIDIPFPQRVVSARDRALADDEATDPTSRRDGADEGDTPAAAEGSQ